MRPASLLLSLCLHTGVFLAIWFWPAAAPITPNLPPMMISLVDGDPGGAMTPSPIMGHTGEPTDGTLAPSAPAPQSEIAAPAREESRPQKPEAAREAEAPEVTPEAPKPAREPSPPPEPQPAEIPVPKKPESKPEPPRPEAKPEPKPKPEPKKPEPKPEPKKPEPKKPEPKKPAPKKPAPRKQNVDPVTAALQKARKATSRVSSGDRGDAVEQALAQARKKSGGTRGGGGGEGAGPGGGALGDVYMGQVMLAVRPNWGFASTGRKNLVCVVKVKVDMQGKVEQTTVTKSSGNPQYDASAVNAIIRTSNAGDFPPPPNINFTDLDIVFTIDELTGR